MAQKFCTRYKYAQLCGVSTQAIDSRIKSGSLKTVLKKDPSGEMKVYIDLTKFPPSKGSGKKV